MIRLPKDFGRKVAKGFNIKAHLEEFIELREYVQMPWLILVGGTLLAIALRFAGAWALLNSMIGSVVPVLNGMVNSNFMFLSGLSYIYLPLLARNMFMSRAKSNKNQESFFAYFFRYLKGMIGLVIFPSSIAFSIMGVLFYLLFPVIVGLQQGPSTVLNMVMMGGLQLILLGVTGLLCWAAFYFIGFFTYAFAFFLQGHCLRESVTRGLRLFMTQRVYTLSLISLFFLVPICIHMSILLLANRYFPSFSGGELLKEFVGYLYMVWYLIYYTIFFAYHKRVSKIPSGR